MGGEAPGCRAGHGTRLSAVRLLLPRAQRREAGRCGARAGGRLTGARAQAAARLTEHGVALHAAALVVRVGHLVDGREIEPVLRAHLFLGFGGFVVVVEGGLFGRSRFNFFWRRACVRLRSRIVGRGPGRRGRLPRSRARPSATGGARAALQARQAAPGRRRTCASTRAGCSGSSSPGCSRGRACGARGAAACPGRPAQRGGARQRGGGAPRVARLSVSAADRGEGAQRRH